MSQEREFFRSKRCGALLPILTAILLGCSGCGGRSSGPSLDSAGARSVSITWIAPTQNTDGSAVTDLSGYRVLYGTSASALDQSVEVAGSSTTGRVISGLAPGTYFFAVAAVNTSGVASDPSNAASMTVQ